MKILAMLAAVAAVYVSLGPPEEAVPTGAPWSCAGPVGECKSNKLPGTFGCSRASGEGDSRDIAVAGAMGDCAAKLERQHSAVFVCIDGSQLACSREKNGGEPQGAPVEGQLNYTCNGEISCRKGGEVFPCSLSTYENAPTQTQAEAQARDSMLSTCASRWNTSTGLCDVDSLSCTPTYQSEQASSPSCERCIAPCIESCKLPGGYNKLCMKECDSRCRDACRESAEPEAASPWWHCAGHVQGCTAPGREGSYGCLDSSGVGPTEGQARADGAHDCELELAGTKPGSWTCSDPSPMKCWENSDQR